MAWHRVEHRDVGVGNDTANVAERLYGSSSITVRVPTLSDYVVAGRPVDLLKIDAEGAELDVLMGISPAHWPLIRLAILEVQTSQARERSAAT